MIVIKLQNRSEVRRIAIADAITFPQLNLIVKDTFQNSLPQAFSLKYKDNENDSVTVSSEAELQEAFRVIKEQNPPILRIEISSEGNCCPFGLRGFFQRWAERRAARCAYWRNRCQQNQESNSGGCRWRRSCQSSQQESTGCASKKACWVKRGCGQRWRCNSSDESQKVPESTDSKNSIILPKAEAPTSTYVQLEEGEDEITPVQSQMYPQLHQHPTGFQPSNHINERNNLSPFETKLKQLEEMGFQNRNKNIELLIKHGGDLLETVKEILPGGVETF